MKKICSLLLTIIIGIMYIPTAMAEAAPVFIKELPAATSPRWKQTYEAYGRTIDIDVDITIPAVELAPALMVRRAPALEDPLKSKLAEEYEQADKQDNKHYYRFKTSNSYSLNLEHKGPLRAGTKKDKEDFSKITSDESDLIRFDPDKAYAENNPMTVREAAEVIRTHLQEVLPDVDIQLDTAWITGASRWKRNKKILFLDTAWITGASRWKRNKKILDDKGFYSLNMRQCFHGIPLMASICETYNDSLDQLWLTGKKDAESYGRLLVARDNHRGMVRGSVFSEDSWHLVACLYEETEILCKDLPLVPFDTVKSQVEDLIMGGYVRWINSVTLGYAQFKTENDDDFVLVPSWIVWCEYIPEGPQAEKEYGINDSELLFDSNSAYYRPLIINAQTGKLYDPESTEPGRIICPDLSAWQ